MGMPAGRVVLLLTLCVACTHESPTAPAAPTSAGICGGSALPRGSGGGGGKVGEWTPVTPPGIDLDPKRFGGDNFGLQDVLVDPARPSDLYAFVTHQGVWKSTDYGQGWTKVNTGPGGAMIDGGKPWGEGIDSDRCRDPRTPPTLYSAGSQGRFWRSQDGGVSWTAFDLPADGKPRPQDGYSVDVDPFDGKHLLVGFHEQTGLAESTDGGETWRSIALADGMAAGSSWYPFFIDTGSAGTTRGTWLMIAQMMNGAVGTWRTGDGGGQWTRVESNEHPHGGSQIFQRDGVLFMAGVYGTQGWGVYRSTDLGRSFTHVGPSGSQATVYGTEAYVYVQPAPFGNQASAARAALPGTDWATWPLPAAVADGPKRVAVTHDGSHAIVVGGNWSAGLWRYVEP
jgi:hypothetical protein